MKSFVLASCVALGLTGFASAGECVQCKPVQATVTTTVEVTKSVVSVPVRAVRGLRSRWAARRAVRRAVAGAACTACVSTPSEATVK